MAKQNKYFGGDFMREVYNNLYCGNEQDFYVHLLCSGPAKSEMDAAVNSLPSLDASSSVDSSNVNS